MTSTPPRGPRLRIIAINDVYTLEHLPRLKTLVVEHGRRDPVDATLVTLAGDFLAPSLLSSLDEGRGMVDALDALGVTHVTFGNHEDDVDVDALRARMAELDARWLSTNVAGFDVHQLAYDLVPVAAPGGRAVTVGLLGVVDADPSVYRRPPFGGAHLEPARDAALAMARRLVDELGAGVVVPLTHQPSADDRALIASQNAAQADGAPPFPIVLGGHDHTTLLEQVGPTWLAKAGSDAVAAIVAELAWPAAAPAAGPDLPRVDVRLEPVAGYAEDAALRALVDRHMLAVRELQGAVLLRIAPDEELSSIGARACQTSLGTCLCTNLRDVTGAELCLLNGGGIRGACAYRRGFTYADLESELPFDNEIVVVPLPGAVIAAAVASSRAKAPAESGGFLQVDDRVVVDAEHRVRAIAGAPLDEARLYRTALMRNLLLGMDHIEPLMAWAAAHPDQVPPETAGREVKLLVVEAFGLRLAKELGGIDQLDTDHDGVLSVAEIAAAIARDAPGEARGRAVAGAAEVTPTPR
ncbi:MAG: 5'-nucleotidase C-terminal domain-containing protein [Myxococcota bacterium]